MAALSDLLEGLHATRPERVLLEDLLKKLPQLLGFQPLFTTFLATSGPEASAIEIRELFHDTGFKLHDLL